MKKLLVSTAVVLFAASSAFAGMGHDAKQKMEEGADSVKDAVTFDRDSLSEGDAKKIETALKDKGFFDGSPDGKIDDSTVESIKKFQSDRKLSADGELNKDTLDALGVDVDLKQAQEATE